VTLRRDERCVARRRAALGGDRTTAGGHLQIEFVLHDGKIQPQSGHRVAEQGYWFAAYTARRRAVEYGLRGAMEQPTDLGGASQSFILPSARGVHPTRPLRGRRTNNARAC
jgi:hypothetical protein